jgi:hypothetical protein
MYFGQSLIADVQTTELMQPRNRAFNHPAVPTQTASMLCVSLSQGRLNAARPQLNTMRFRVVGSVTLHPLWATTGTPALAAHGRSGNNCVTSWWFAPVNRSANGMPWASVIR